MGATLETRGSSDPALLESPMLVGTLANTASVIDYANLDATHRDADVVEVRLDLIPRDEWDRVFAACDRLESSGTPVLSTLRLKSDGGEWTGEDADRLPIFQRAIEHSSWVDVEATSKIASAVCDAAHKGGKKTLVSSHDFVSTPSGDQLEQLYTKSLLLGADIVKVATMTTVREHHTALINLVARHASEGKICAMGMGSFGLPLRIYLPVIGSRFAYAFLGRPSAPGQLSCSHMVDLLRLQMPRFNERYLARTKSLEAA